ncbi:MAG TPA: TlpA disulfide reductase family protein [Candidatus Thermoplasmatota archaeon]
MARPQPPARVPARKSFLTRVRRSLGRQPRPGEGQAIVAAYALVTVALLLSPFVTTGAPDPTGTRAPSFTLPTTAGPLYDLDADLGARPIMVEFMHPECSHCQAMSDALVSAHAAYGSQVVFLSVAVPLGSFGVPTTEEVASFREFYGHSWPYLVSSDDRVSRDYSVSATPTFFFISADGTIRSKQEGELPFSLLAGELQAIAGG